MPQFRKKPVIIAAYQWDGSFASIRGIADWAGKFEGEPIIDWITTLDGSLHQVQVQTLEGPLNVSPGDWIICGIAGEFYPCKPDIFEQTYEVVS